MISGDFSRKKVTSRADDDLLPSAPCSMLGARNSYCGGIAIFEYWSPKEQQVKTVKWKFRSAYACHLRIDGGKLMRKA